ncbi:hypothetical protein [Mycobacterium stomatepiae]|uniref:Uncharacterized protein n=1 Tax=Mycobacterium stomatepiae TaxID=470076 RepID=A0A7I7QGX4_9MYCO|nr:hypothetical protein [Mycobacterium stomatepiae]MCV7167047.1 hypothetical protein [Mycobacterium stomatepiae]BBY25432.1 hypothetical protein MSTO_56370 [Mycobacterium stomatepiae]
MGTAAAAGLGTAWTAAASGLGAVGTARMASLIEVHINNRARPASFGRARLSRENQEASTPSTA